MADYEASVPSLWTQDRTFDYLADFTNVAEWDPSIESSVLVGGQAGQVGARYEVTMSMAGRQTTIPYTATEVTRPERLVLRGETDSFVSLDTITVRPAGQGSELTYHAEVELKGVRKLADPLMDIALTRASNKAKDSLAERLSA